MISQEDWELLRLALEDYLSAVVDAWQDPSFRPDHIFPTADRRSVVTTAASGESPLQLLPSIGHPIRGVDGTKVDVDKPERQPTIEDAIYAAKGGIFGQKTSAELEVIAARDRLRNAIVSSSPLSRALQLISWGPGAVEHFDKVGPDEDSLSVSIALGHVGRVLAKSLQDQNYTVQSLADIRDDVIPTSVHATLDSLRKTVEAEHFSFSVVALLNSPPIDALAWVAVEATWQGGPFTVTLGYPVTSPRKTWAI